MIRDDLRVNRTGVAMTPMQAQAQMELAKATPPSSLGGADLLLDTRMRAADEGGPLGNLPPPLSDRGADMIAKKGVGVLLDMLGERLAVERTAVRLGDALLDKHAAYGSWDGGPGRTDLQQFRGETLEHFLLVRHILDEMGADSTALTPSAALHGMIGLGFTSVLTDPRTDLLQCVECILVAELASCDRWEALVDLAVAVGEEAFVPEISRVLEQKQEQLHRLRLWHAIGLSQRATGGWAAPFAQRARRRATAQNAAGEFAQGRSDERGRLAEGTIAVRVRRDGGAKPFGRRRSSSTKAKPRKTRATTTKPKKASTKITARAKPTRAVRAR